LKLAGIEVTGAALRERAAASTLADGIADAVMARIQQETKEKTDEGKNGAAPAGSVAVKAAPIENGAAGGEPHVLREIAGGAQKAPARASFEKRPANDNARGIFTLAALAAAAAAALMVWGRMEGEPPRAMTTAQPPTESVAVQVPAPAPPPPSAERESGSEGEANPGVEVAAVDFGARMGTIFYIPTDSSATSAMTTVVWLSDDGIGGQ
jgi:hypothetical protein